MENRYRQRSRTLAFSGTGGDRSPNVFAHFSAIKGYGLKTLKDSQKVAFTVTLGQKGPQAEDVLAVFQYYEHPAEPLKLGFSYVLKGIRFETGFGFPGRMHWIR